MKYYLTEKNPLNHFSYKVFKDKNEEKLIRLSCWFFKETTKSNIYFIR